MRKERRRRKKAHPKRAPIFRSPNPLQDPCNLRLSLFLSLKNSKLTLMEKMMAMEWIGVSDCPDTLQYKGKTEAEPLEVEEAREGKPLDRVKSTPPRPLGSPRSDRGCHHGQWWLPRSGRGAHCGGCPVLLLRCVLVSFGASPWAAGFSFPWGILGLFTSFFWSSWPTLH